MKVAESKSSATAPLLQKKNAEQQTPFFQPEQAGSAIDNSQPAFFSPKGNSSIQRKPFFIQPKLTIGQPGDQYEQEADRMADQVVQRLAENNNAVAAPPTPVSPGIQRKCADCEKEEQLQPKEEPGEEEQLRMKPIFESAAPPPDDDTVQRKCAACAAEEQEQPIQTKANSTNTPTASPDLESRLQATKGGGSPLPKAARTQMEGAFGADFSGVRVHTDSSAVQMNKELGAQAFTHGSDIYFNAGKFDTGSTSGQRLLGHELTHVGQQGGGSTCIQKTPEDDLISTHTSWGFLDEAALGRELLQRALQGNYVFVEGVLNELGSTDRDDISFELISVASNNNISSIGQSERGRRLLDRIFDELTSGSVSQEEQSQADRILTFKESLIPQGQFPQILEGIKIFPFRVPGMTVLNDAPISAQRRSNGKIWVNMPVRVLGTSQFRNETRTLPTEVFIGGIEIPENELIGVKLYDLGGPIVYRSALLLVQLANETDTAILSTLIEVAGIGITLGTGELIALGVEASMAARVLLWADRAAFVLGTLSTIINDHRGWIIETFGENGRQFVEYNSIVQRAVAIYGMARFVYGMGSLLNNFRRSYNNLRSSTREASGRLTRQQQGIARSIENQSDDFFSQADEIGRARSASSATPQAAELPVPASSSTATATSTGSQPISMTSLVGTGDALRRAISWIRRRSGFFDVLIHGTPGNFQVLHNGRLVIIDHRRLYNFMRSNGYRGGNVRLLSCNTGATPTSIARDLANKIGYDVIAPSDTLWIHPNGSLTIGPSQSVNSGTWNTFSPGSH